MTNAWSAACSGMMGFEPLDLLHGKQWLRLADHPERSCKSAYMGRMKDGDAFPRIGPKSHGFRQGTDNELVGHGAWRAGFAAR
jgi:hypothetical protein